MCLCLQVLLGFLLILSKTFTKGEQSKCEKLASKAAWIDHNTIVETNPKMLAGTWISERCETRPGPEYILRYYTFSHDGIYNLIQHHYWDDSCSSPKLTITSHGRIQMRNSLIQPGAVTGLSKPINITVIPQDNKAAKELDRIVSSECPNQYWKTWRRYDEHLVFDNKHEEKFYNLWSSSYNINNQKNVLSSSGDINCLGSLKWAFNELKLIKIQFRPVINHKKHPREMEMELLLGDIHSNRKHRQFYTSTSFQTALIKQGKNENITLNRHLYHIKGTVNTYVTYGATPPHLLVKPHLPPYIWGEWTSIRCEIRPLGLYLTRHFSFFEKNSTWIGDHKFYSDPFCTVPKFIVTAAGHYDLIGWNTDMKGTSNIDFKIEKASLTVLEEEMIYELRLPGYCGRDEWKVNVPKELSSTNGCIYLGIIIPSIQYDIVKIEMDYNGSWMLFLGQPDTNNAPRNELERPTAFQSPLVKCSEVPNFSGNLKEILGDRLYSNSNFNKLNLSWSLYLFITLFYIIR